MEEKVSYHRRSVAETAMYQIKTLLGMPSIVLE
jgi:hypothetical protein